MLRNLLTDEEKAEVDQNSRRYSQWRRSISVEFDGEEQEGKGKEENFNFRDSDNNLEVELPDTNMNARRSMVPVAPNKGERLSCDQLGKSTSSFAT